MPERTLLDPRVGDVIRQRNPRYFLGRLPRRVIAVDAYEVETEGVAGGQRNSRMSRSHLIECYEFVARVEDGRAQAESETEAEHGR